MFYYHSFQEQCTTPELGTYTTFGIAVLQYSDGKWQLVFSVSDVSFEEQRVLELAALCTRLQLHPMHLCDVVEDALCECN